MQRAIARAAAHEHRAAPRPTSLPPAQPVLARARLQPPDDGLAATLARCVRTRAAGRPLLQRSPLNVAATKRDYGAGNLVGYVEEVVRPWLQAVIEEHPEAAGTAEDQLTDLDTGNVDYSWDGIELFVEMVNAKIGQESPQFAGVVEQEERAIDYGAGWVTRQGQLTVLAGGAKATARADLVELISKLSGNIYSTSVGTVIGGYGVKAKNVKKIGGLSETTARIDCQNPISDGTYNVQYQTETVSHAAAIFTDADPQAVVLAKLLDSFDRGLILVSPRAG